MTVLSNKDIADAMESGQIVIDPCPFEDCFATTAVDLRLGQGLSRWQRPVRGTELRVNCWEATIPVLAGRHGENLAPESDGAFSIPPGSSDVFLGITLERIYLPPDSCIAARVEGRSSLARLGLSVHITAPIIHAGFDGQITLELVNHGPYILRIKPVETRICQLIFETVKTPPTVPIRTAFQHQTNPFGTTGNR